MREGGVVTWNSHEPPDYHCPFCRIQLGVHDDLNQPTDLVAVTEHVFARVSPRWWNRNPGTVLVIPRAHHENLYDLPDDVGADLVALTRRVARAVRPTYPACAGVTLLQNNEPAGGQDVWHLHVHVLARYPGDGLYDLSRADREDRWVGADERGTYADRLAAVLDEPRGWG